MSPPIDNRPNAEREFLATYERRAFFIVARSVKALCIAEVAGQRHGVWIPLSAFMNCAPSLVDHETGAAEGLIKKSWIKRKGLAEWPRVHQHPEENDVD